MVKVFLIGVVFYILIGRFAYAEKNPLQWLAQMDLAYHNNNFSLSITHLQRNRVQSFLFEHGIVESKQVVYVKSLTGPISYSYRIDNLVTYIDPEVQPYSVHANTIAVPSPSFFINKQAAIERNYNVSLAGKGRVAGRVTQLVRLKAKDKNRFNYVLWLDIETALLLRYDSFDLQNNLIEQMQVIQAQWSPQASNKLTELVAADIPSLKMAPAGDVETRWKFNWLPQDYQIIATDSHRLLTTTQPVDYLMLSDGLSEVSVYIARAGEVSFPERLITQGGTAVARHRQGSVDITVVGKIPLDTATKIARSITLK
ncbi:MAG: MucB/RseB C-terminal domain-containing protein [Gammaproteobacteria bacterium]|nr:MucB/RseB C-terminal domain-containing protein [Gammaproteobacteria bacterium]